MTSPSSLSFPNGCISLAGEWPPSVPTMIARPSPGTGRTDVRTDVRISTAFQIGRGVAPRGAALAARAAMAALAGWVDVDTPAAAGASASYWDGAPLQLVFSDEFERDGRTFRDGEDSRWTALQLPPSTNEQVNWYNESLAVTREGFLDLIVTNDDVTFDAGNGTVETRHLQTAMLQTWNKFCFSEGAVEIRAKMPGLGSQEGLWPAFWLMGNLGRATFTASTDGMWPWTFDECVEPGSEDCFANQCDAQLISACNPSPGFGLNPFQGRGAPEIDIIEIQPGSYNIVYQGKPDCDLPDAATRDAVFMRQPFVSTSLQAAPGFPLGSDQRPFKSCVPQVSNLSLEMQWYPELDIFRVRNSSTYDVALNYEFWGDLFTQYMDGVGLQTDAYSVDTALEQTHWEEYHTYRCEWRSGENGFMRWSLDGITQFSIGASLLRERPVSVGGVPKGTRRRLQMPTEPMYLILNVDSSPRWGWPTHSKDTDCDAPCECCYDCKRLECTRCLKVDGITGATVNTREWFAKLCDTLPTVFSVDWVRVYQLPSSVSTGCSTPSHPTRVWIASHEDAYRTDVMQTPMLSVVPGGEPCRTSAVCNQPHGQCIDGECVCISKNWTGPRCLSQAAGDPSFCRDFEDDARSLSSPLITEWSQSCAAPRTYNITWLRALRTALCEAAALGDRPRAGQACNEVNATQPLAVFAMCSEFARTTHVIRSWLVDSGQTQCCNAFSIDTKGHIRLHCKRGSDTTWLLLGVPVLLLIGVLIFFGRRRLRPKLSSEKTPSISIDDHGKGDEQTSDTAGQLAQSLLSCCAGDARKQRREVVEGLRHRFGFQAASCEVQLHHAETLLISHLSKSDGNYTLAIRNLHASLFQPFERWLLHVSLRSSVTDMQSGPTSTTMVRSKKITTHSSWLFEDLEAAYQVWSLQPVEKQLQEVLLYLLLWGEAGNLRFMPELLWFLFELARAHLLAHNVSVAQENSYLDQVVEPIYSIIFHEAFSSIKNGRPQPIDTAQQPSYLKNYDDWNELFWSLASIACIRTNGAGGSPLLQAAPEDRWPLLSQVDWQAFFGTRQKTFTEERWWYCLLASNRRLILLHAITFTGCFLIALPAAWEMRHTRVIPVMCVYAPLSAVAGAIFEAWAIGGKVQWHKLASSCLVLCIMVGLCVWISFLQNAQQKSSEPRSFPRFDTGDQGSEQASDEWALLSILNLLIAALGARQLILELLPRSSDPDAFDSNLFFERRTAGLARGNWVVRWRYPFVAQEVQDVLSMYFFWVLVWAGKMTLGSVLLLPATFDAHNALVGCFPTKELVDSGEYSELTLLTQPSRLVQLTLLGGLWLGAVLAYFTDTLLWYSCVSGLWGGVMGLKKHGVARKLRHWDLQDVHRMRENCAGKIISQQVKASKSDAWRLVWHQVVDDLYEGDLINKAEQETLLKGDGEGLSQLKYGLHCMEARRRLHFFAHSLADPQLPRSDGAVSAPGMTVLIPHYAEPILVSPDALRVSSDVPELGSRASKWLKSSTTRRLPVKSGRSPPDSNNLMAMLISYFPREWSNFVARMVADGSLRRRPPSCSFTAASWGAEISQRDDSHAEDLSTQDDSMKSFGILLSPRKWASLRTQTLYRCICGMMKNRAALRVLLRLELPHLPEELLRQIAEAKFTCLAAMQRYHSMSEQELQDVEDLMKDFPSLQIAYIEEETVSQAHGVQQSRFYSCLVDSTCAKKADGHREPRYRVALPGHPILGNGKSDNQNHAIIFSTGTIIQAIDANQEGYIEESFKLVCALQEFDAAPAGSHRGPAIVGFREHIFSHLGSLGEFAATSEAIFGTLAQQTMATTLWSRYHYGHPDMLDKFAMMAQGGISKATKGLNLSEDIFAGMDAQLRGKTVVHRGYYQVGKGRDMGFLSILGFFSKLSMGTAQMSSSRQAYRLGVRLGLARLCGFYYGHTGYYVGQLHFYQTTFVLLSLTFLGAIAEGTDVLPLSGDAASHLTTSVYNALYLLFFAASIVPLLLMLFVEKGVVAAFVETIGQLLSGAPIFYAFQSRCIAHFISGEFNTGGAMYIPTGRGLALERQDFSTLYSSFALACFYPGAELAALVVLPLLACPTLQLGWSFFLFASYTPASLLLSPLIFNPSCFDLELQWQDIHKWLKWLMDDSGKGWMGYHRSICSRKKNTKPHSFVLPSKLMLLTIPIVLIAHEAMKPFHWGFLEVAYIALPLVQVAISASLVLIHSLCGRPPWVPEHSLILAAALIFGVVLVVETAIFGCYTSGLSAAHWITLVALRYCCWRWTANGLAYACEQESISLCACSTVKTIREVILLGVSGHALLLDFLLGLLLQSTALLLALVPFLPSLHMFCLFRASESQVLKSSLKQKKGLEEVEARARSRAHAREWA